MINLTPFVAHVFIKVERERPGQWKSYAQVWEHQPRTNRTGRVLAPYSPSVQGTTIAGTDKYRTVRTQAEALKLAIDHARAYIRSNRQAHNKYCRDLAALRKEQASYLEGLAAVLWAKRDLKEHLLRAEVARLLTAAGRNDTDKKHDPDMALSPYTAVYRIKEIWKALQADAAATAEAVTTSTH